MAIAAFSAFLGWATLSYAAHRPRIVSLAPSSTEILFALGLDEEIVGVSQFCDFPEKTAGKARVGTFSEPNVELILSLKPDIIFCTGLEQGPAVAKLRQLGFNVCVSDPASIEELFASIRQVGALVQREPEAEALVAGMRGEVDAIAQSVKAVPQERRPKVFVEIWHTPMMTAGAGSMVDDIITKAGGRNIARDTAAPYGSFSSEEVIRRDPDIVVLTYMQRPDQLSSVASRLGWGEVAAIRNGRVYGDIDSDILLRPGPRIIDGLKELHKRMYR